MQREDSVWGVTVRKVFWAWGSRKLTCEEGVLGLGVQEGGGEALLRECDLVGTLVVQLEPGVYLFQHFK